MVDCVAATLQEAVLPSAATRGIPLELDLNGSAELIAGQIARALQLAIVKLQIPPGERLSEQDVASRLGVSRQPVREAFIKLKQAGLLTIMPQRSTVVVKISTAALENARFIREAVECAIAREAARLGYRDFGRVSDNLARQRQDREVAGARSHSFRWTRSSTTCWPRPPGDRTRGSRWRT